MEERYWKASEGWMVLLTCCPVSSSVPAVKSGNSKRPCLSCSGHVARMAKYSGDSAVGKSDGAKFLSFSLQPFMFYSTLFLCLVKIMNVSVCMIMMS